MFELIQGSFSPIRALPLIFQDRRTLVLSLAPVGVSAILWVFAIYISFVTLSPWLPVDWPVWNGFSEISAWLMSLGTSLFHLSLRMLGGVAFWFLSFSVSCSLLYSTLVEHVERRLGPPPGGFQPLPITAQILDGILISSLLLTGGFLAFLGSLLPIIGLPSAILFVTLLQGFLLGSECHDFSLGLRGIKTREKLRYLWQHKARVLGTGLLSLIFLPVPIFNACFLTLGILGATLNIRELESLPSPSQDKPSPFDPQNGH